MTRLNHLALNKCHLNFSTAGTALIPKKKRSGIPSAIRDSMVLWYDVKHQGCSNESMAANPVLRDLSGNGHDATCYNFAWSGMSGIGGYKTDYTKYYIQNGRGTLQVTDTKIVIKNIVLNDALIETTTTNLGLIPAYKIKVSGIPDGAKLRYAYFIEEHNGAKSYYDIASDGEYELPANTYLKENVGFIISEFTGECNITIEQLPLYSNALVSDGVDDYAVVENAPILYNGKGFTIIAKREFLQSINKNHLSAIIADNRLETLDGAFLFEGLWTDTRALLNFGKPIYNQIFPELYSYMTSVEYNGEKIPKGQIEHGSEKYTIFACDINNIIYPLSVALYSLLLFDRDLTEEEIEWVKTNLMSE